MTDTLHLEPARNRQKAVLLFMAAALVLLVATLVGYRIMHPDMLSPVPYRAQAPQQPAQNDQVTQNIMALMQRIQSNPQDRDALIALTQHFLHLESWDRAEEFGKRAVSAAPDDVMAHYLLSVALHGHGHNEEAATSLERALELKNDPAMRYSLGILYAYYLDKKDKAAEQFRLGLEAEGVSESLAKSLREELENF